MTFQISRAEWMEANTVYARSKNRFWMLIPVLFCLELLVVSFGFWRRPSPMSGFFCVLVLGLIVHSYIWIPYRLKKKFRSQPGSDMTRPIHYDFSPEGFVLHGESKDFRIGWSDIANRIEGRNVWLLVLKGKKQFFFIFPKHATDSSEGKIEWAIVDSALAPPPSAPIAHP